MNRNSVIGGLVLALGLGAAAQAAETDDVGAGKVLALQLCSACHRVSPDQPASSPKLPWPAPAFVAIANGEGVDEGNVFEFLRANHRSGKTPPEMPALVLTEDQAKAATAYLMSLRKAP